MRDLAVFYDPFITKLTEWALYDENKPTSNYRGHEKEHDEYRAVYDRDCILTGGNLNADTIFSLWLPLRHTISRINTRDEIAAVGAINNKYSFCRDLLKEDNLAKLLPYTESIVNELRELFVLGLRRCNVMLLPQRWLNTCRGRAPYYDYMPRFLYELFPGGAFSTVFSSETELIKWIEKEALDMFFDGEVKRENLIDLCGSGDICVSLAPEGINPQIEMIKRYTEILRKRHLCQRTI